MAYLINALLSTNNWVSNPDLWERIIGWLNSGIKNIGWTIVIFTICLKIILLPLDIYQKSVSAKTTKKQEEMRPDLEKVKKLYSNDPNMYNQKTMEVYKAHNFNVGTSCFGLLINMVLTMVIFFTLFSSLRNISHFMIQDEYNTLKQTYIASYLDYDLSSDTTEEYAEFNRLYLGSNITAYDEDKKELYVNYYLSLYQNGIDKYNEGLVAFENDYNAFLQVEGNEGKSKEQFLASKSYTSVNQYLVADYFPTLNLGFTVTDASNEIAVAKTFANTTADSKEAYKNELSNFSLTQLKERYNSDADKYVVEGMKHIAKKEYAQKVVLVEYQDIKEGWLWIKNIYLTDTATQPFPNYKTFVKNADRRFNYNQTNKYIDVYGNVATNNDKAKELEEIEFNDVTMAIQHSVEGQWNGFYILIIMAGLITYLSSRLLKGSQPKQTTKVRNPDGTVTEKEVNSMGLLNWLLPLMMVYFTWSYTGLFALYIVINSTMSIVITMGTKFVKKYFIKSKTDLVTVNGVKVEDNFNPNNYRLNNKYTVIDDKNDSKK